uniref:WRKY20 transcription factor n=1 Tax=Isatis tinctoria TaxID=161756 RepID=A0A6G8R7J3_ISATI|nr:WRKY20 transcription factor [Isatis tinctoria]
MVMEEKLVINELEQGRELAKRLMSNLKHTSSVESSKTLISEILRIYQNAIFMLSFNEDDKNILKRSREVDDKDSKNVFKKRKIPEKRTEKVRIFVGAVDDGYCWRKYGQKEIHGSINPRGYFRCTHRFTQKCLAVKQVQKSDKDPSIYEVKYVGDHTCNNSSTSPKTATASFSVSMFGEGNRADVPEDVKPTKTEEVMISLEDVENKKDIFRTFSFSNHEIENVGGWKSSVFQENLMENLSPATTSGSGITSEIVTAPASVENSETADSYFSSLDNIIDFGQDWLWSEL